MAICELICWGILLRDLERKNERHHDFVALQNLSVVCPLIITIIKNNWDGEVHAPYVCKPDSR